MDNAFTSDEIIEKLKGLEIRRMQMNKSITPHDVLPIDAPNVRICIALAALALVWHAINHGYSVQISEGIEAGEMGLGIEFTPQAI